MKVSQRVSALPVSPTRRYLGLAKEAEGKGKHVLRLSIGQPDLQPPREYFEALAQIPEGRIPYPNASGLEELRVAQQRYYARHGIDFAPNEIFVTDGAMGAIEFSILATCDPGDVILLIEPFYSNYAMITHLTGVDFRTVTTKAEEDFVIPSEEAFEAQYCDGMKAILLSSPCNPTGRMYRRDELETIVRFAKKHDLIILADEVYREFYFVERPFVSFYEFLEIRPQLVLLDSASKKYAVCGARIGTASTHNKALQQSFAKLCQMRLGVSASEQQAVAALGNVDPRYHEGVREIYRTRRQVMLDAFSKMEGIRYSQPEGAFYSLVKLPVKNAEAFVQWMLTDFDCEGETVLLTPAGGFYSSSEHGQDEIRISYCVDEEELKRALRIVNEGLKAYPDKK